jgi:hypothetical protein
LDYYLDLETSEAELPLIFGVLELREIPDYPINCGDLLAEVVEELLLFEVASISKLLSLAVREELVSKSLGSATLKMESVGTLGVES